MTIRTVLRAAMPVAMLCCALPAQAADVVFSGSITNAVSNVAMPSNCPNGVNNTYILPTTGTSNLGSFSYSSNVCQVVGQPITGTFEIMLGDGSFLGTQSGLATPIAFTNGKPTLLSLLINYTITGGTGAYAGATGVFVGRGTINASSSPSLISLNFAPLPEPATWAMMLMGFAGIGLTVRRSRGSALIPMQT